MFLTNFLLSPPPFSPLSASSDSASPLSASDPPTITYLRTYNYVPTTM